MVIVMNKEEILNTFLLANIPEIITQEEFDDVKKAIKDLQQENQELKKQLEEYQQELEKADSITQSCIFNGKEGSKISYRKCLNILDKKETQQKEFIKYLENGINICDGFLDTVKSDLQEMSYGVISAGKTYITTRIKENETAHKVYEEILQEYKKIIGE